MRKISELCALAVAFALLSAGSSVAQEQKATADTKAVSDAAKPAAAKKTEAKKPAPLFEYGFEQRTRGEYYNNVGDFNDNVTDSASTNHRVRFRTKMWTKYAATDNVDFFFRLDNEFRKTSNPDTKFSQSAPDEVIIDSLYLDFKKLFTKGLSLRVGRQDIQRGEGFILNDGTPLDGSRSTYFNAAVFGYSWKKSKFEIIGATQPRNDRHLPRFNDREKPLSEYNEDLIGAYYSNKNIKNTEFDTYYFLKKESRDLRTSKAVFTPDRHVGTLGARGSRKLPDDVTVSGEFAYQFGVQSRNRLTGGPQANISAFAGYGRIRRDFTKTPWKPYVQGGYFAVSGDDYRSNAKVEGWDPVFSRFPIRSELMFYGYQKEKGIGYWTNTRLAEVAVGLQPNKHVKSSVQYMHADAYHPYRDNPGLTAAAKANFGTGIHRGGVIRSYTEVLVNDNWKGHLLYETMNPGNFYTNHDRGYFFRAEVMYTFKSAFGIRAPKK